MVDQRSFRAGHALHDKNADPRRPNEFSLLDREWSLLDGVFSPVYTFSTQLFSTWLPYPAGGTFLEVGCGTGVTSVVAALAGCHSVTALDISSAAVENTRLNAERHGVGAKVRVLKSDLFEGLGPERFDLIFWNSNFVEAPTTYVHETDLHHSFFDPGYAAHRRYLTEAANHLTDQGRVTLGFSDLGNRRLLDEFADAAGLTVHVLGAESHTTALTVEYQLLELLPKAASGSR